jgi:hypothetical protein
LAGFAFWFFFWLFGFLAFWLFGFLAFWLFGFLAFWLFGFFGFFGFFGYLAFLAFWPLGFLIFCLMFAARHTRVFNWLFAFGLRLLANWVSALVLADGVL